MGLDFQEEGRHHGHRLLPRDAPRVVLQLHELMHGLQGLRRAVRVGASHDWACGRTAESVYHPHSSYLGLAQLPPRQLHLPCQLERVPGEGAGGVEDVAAHLHRARGEVGDEVGLRGSRDEWRVGDVGRANAGARGWPSKQASRQAGRQAVYRRSQPSNSRVLALSLSRSAAAWCPDPLMRKVRGRGRRSASINAPHSSSGTIPCAL